MSAGAWTCFLSSGRCTCVRDLGQPCWSPGPVRLHREVWGDPRMLPVAHMEVSHLGRDSGWWCWLKCHLLSSPAHLCLGGHWQNAGFTLFCDVSSAPRLFLPYCAAPVSASMARM